MADDKKDQDTHWGRFATIGLEAGVGVILGVVVGSWLDKKFGWEPWGLLVSTLLGTAAGMYQLVREGIRVNKD
jgi:F0F1-type ATP synthase assembly protein I